MSIRVAALQLAAHDREQFAQAWPRIDAALGTALDEGANLVVLPEGTLPGYVMGVRPFDEAETAKALERCRERARAARAVIVAGAARTTAAGTTNSAIVVDTDGSIAGSADKHFLWHFDRQWFAQGERIAPIATSLGTLGVMICADGRIPLIANALVSQGAQMLVMPTAWVTSGRDPANLENVQADLLARVRARENGVPFVAANKVGTERGCALYCGKSQIVDADGTIAVMASQDRQEIVSATIEPAKPSRARPLPAAAALNVPDAPLRVAVMARPPQTGDEERMATIGAELLVHPQSPDLAGDDAVTDPRGLAALRLGGARIAAWRTSLDPAWQLAFARARALELRMYVIVLDESRRRAFAVDPDGAPIAGTFGAYEMASFVYDPSRTLATEVAPGTDVLEGLRRAARHAPV